jgi:2',3'-cyclic-nucleotide 2'-phosphodiesterase (5'-nucleotidase family)
MAAIAMLVLATGSVSAATSTNESPLGTVGVQKAEVSLGDLIADAVRSALGTDFAFVSASELKERDAQIPKGLITTDDVTAFIAYTDDPIWKMKLTGKQVKQALERSIIIYPKNNLGFLQVSGLRFTYDPSQPPENRVTQVFIGEKGNKQLQDTTVYTVAMTSSMANGALGYWKIWSKDDVDKPTETTIPQAIDQFLSGKSSVNYSTLNRIVAVK